MLLLPWLTEEFHSSLSPAELRLRMQANALPPAWRTLAKGLSSCSFHGRIGSNSFKIFRLPQGRGSLRPVIEGQFNAASAGGSQLRLRYRLSWSTLLFAVFWLSMTGIWIIAGLSQPSVDGSLAGAIILFGFGLLLFTIPFWLEVNEARHLLTYLLKLKAAEG